MFLLLLLFSFSSHASMVSYHNANPVGWMHALPAGETPGWASNSWFGIELNHANIWNQEFTMTDRRNGNIYTYFADFEQSSAIADFGYAFSPHWALEAEVPYTYRNGGVLDDFIDQFHQVIGSSRFMRNINREFGYHYKVQTNGVDNLATEHGEGLGSSKLKLKYWFWQWRGGQPGACDCGLAVSGHVKFPTQRRDQGISSGANDYTAMIHLGVPIGKYSGAWYTHSVTWLGPNDTFKEWPRRIIVKMHELTLNIGFGQSFGMLLQARMESPLFNQDDLEFNYTYVDEVGQKAERIASGYNSLVHWRGSESIGFRWLWSGGSQVNFLMVEDWGIGHEDSRSDWLYVNNAPDVAFISQLHFAF
jgi:hypothetical protein